MFPLTASLCDHIPHSTSLPKISKVQSHFLKPFSKCPYQFSDVVVLSSFCINLYLRYYIEKSNNFTQFSKILWIQWRNLIVIILNIAHSVSHSRLHDTKYCAEKVKRRRYFLKKVVSHRQLNKSLSFKKQRRLMLGFSQLIWAVIPACMTWRLWWKPGGIDYLLSLMTFPTGVVSSCGASTTTKV